MTPARQPMLDVVRGVAILLVLVFHLGFATGIAPLDAMLTPVIDAGWAGVDLFFVLSGFLVGRMILAEADTPAGFDRRRFYARRILRLWPVLYLYLLTLLVIGGGAAWPVIFPVLLHVQNYAVHIPSHLWSLAVEEHFYLAAALALPWLLRRAGARGVAAMLIATLVGCLLLRSAALLLGESTNHLQWRTPYRIDALAAGVLIAWAERWRPDLLARAARHRRAGVAFALIGFATLAAMADERVRFTLGLTLAYLAGAAVVVASLNAPSPRWPTLARVLAWLGGISYSLYIWHVSLGRVADALAPHFGLDWSPAHVAWRYAVAIGGAVLVAIYVERPMMRLRNRQAEGRALQSTIAIANRYQ